MSLPVLWRGDDTQGAKAVLNVLLDDLPPRARVGDLVGALNKELRAHTEEVRSLQLYGTRLSDDRKLAALIPELGGDCPRLVVTTQNLVCKDDIAETVVFVTTLTGKTITVGCLPSDTIDDVKVKVERREGIPAEHQQLTYAGKSLRDDKLLSEYAIRSESTFHLSLRLLGGWIPSRMFADLTDDELLTKQEFSDAAPKWRMYSEGLNIEGRCKTRSCVAFDQLVLHPKHFKTFNLMRDGSVPCPMCRMKVKPITCGLYKCVWKFEGIQSGDSLAVSSPWKLAIGDRKYHRFDADESYSCVKWETLLVAAKSTKDLPVLKPQRLASSGFTVSDDDICCICWSKFGSSPTGSIVKVHCGHSFHRACVAALVARCVKKGLSFSCPICCRRGASAER